MAEWILVMGCGAFAVAIAWYSDRRKIRKFIVSFRKLQAMLVTPLRFREPTSSDSGLFDGIAEAKTIETKHGLRYLGDVVVEIGDASGPCRVFVDANGTSVFYLMRSGMSVESYTAELSLETKTAKRMPWTEPPFKMQQNVASDIPVSGMLVAHREFVTGATPEPLRRFEVLADVLHAWQELQARTMSWRAAQDPDELMQQDLRMLGGPKSGVLWARFGPQLRAEIPRAQARRRAP